MRRQNNEKGYILIGVLLVFSLFAILGVSLTTLSITSVKSSKVEHDNQSAFYIAEAGLNYQLDQIKNEIIDKNISTEEQLSYEIEHFKSIHEPEEKEFEQVSNLDTYATFDIEQLESTETSYAYEITSHGHIGDQSRSVKQTFTIKWNEGSAGEGNLPPFAVFTSGNFSMSNGTINGDIGTKSTEKEAISFPSGGPSFNGEVHVPNGDETLVYKAPNTPTVKETIKSLDNQWKIPELPEFPEIPNLPLSNLPNIQLNGDPENNLKINLDKSQTFKDISIGSGLELTFDLGDHDQEIVVKNLILNYGKLKIKGNGRLTIYIEESFKMAGSSEINPNNDIDQLNIFWKGSNPAKELAFYGDDKIYGSLYAENANISLGASGSIEGNLFTGGQKLTIGGGSKNQTQLFLAPNANINFNAGGTLNGMVISKEFKISGGGTVNFDQELDNYITGPISVEALDMGASDPGTGGGSGGESVSPQVSVEKTGALREVTD